MIVAAFGVAGVLQGAYLGLSLVRARRLRMEARATLLTERHTTDFKEFSLSNPGLVP